MSLARHTGYNIAGQVIPIVVSLITVPFYLHLIGIERYGVLAIVWMLLGYFGLFDLGLTRASAYRIAFLKEASPRARATSLWTALLLSMLLGVTGGSLLYLGGFWYLSGPLDLQTALRSEAIAALPILAVALPVTILTAVLNGAMQGRERFLDINVITVGTMSLVQIMPLLAAWWIGPALPVVIAASFVAQLGGLLVFWQRARRHVLERHRFKFSREEGMILLRYGGWITISSISSPIMVVIDRFVIGWLMSAAAVATYVVPAQLAQRASIIPNAASSALFPRLIADPTGATSREATRVFMAAMSPAVLIGVCLMEPFLDIWLQGALPPEAALVGRIALLGWWVNGLAISPFLLLQAQGRPHITAVLHMCELPIYFALLYVLIGRYGLAGAASAFALRCAIDWLALILIVGKGKFEIAIYVVPAFFLAVAMIVGREMDLGFANVLMLLALLLGVSTWSYFVIPKSVRAKWKYLFRGAFGAHV